MSKLINDGFQAFHARYTVFFCTEAGSLMTADPGIEKKEPAGKTRSGLNMVTSGIYLSELVMSGDRKNWIEISKD